MRFHEIITESVQIDKVSTQLLALAWRLKRVPTAAEIIPLQPLYKKKHMAPPSPKKYQDAIRLFLKDTKNIFDPKRAEYYLRVNTPIPFVHWHADSKKVFGADYPKIKEAAKLFKKSAAGKQDVMAYKAQQAKAAVAAAKQAEINAKQDAEDEKEHVEFKKLAKECAGWLEGGYGDIDFILNHPYCQQYKNPKKCNLTNGEVIYRAIDGPSRIAKEGILKKAIQQKTKRPIISYSIYSMHAHNAVQDYETGNPIMVFEKKLRVADFVFGFTDLVTDLEERGYDCNCRYEEEVWMKPTPYYTTYTPKEQVEISDEDIENDDSWDDRDYEHP